MPFRLTPNGILFSIIFSVGVFLFYKTIPTTISPLIKATISQQNGTIYTLDTPRNILSSKILYLDTIDFPQGNSLRHTKLGQLGYSRDFFIDVETYMEVLQSGTYHFLIASDDGFRLFIDNKPIGEFTGDRPMNTNECVVYLEKGEHTLFISYFQGYGNLGFQGYYRHASTNQYNFIGKSSGFVDFMKIKVNNVH